MHHNLIPSTRAMPEFCPHRSREEWRRDYGNNWCFTCWVAARTEAWASIEAAVASTLQYGGHVREQLPSGLLIDWWIEYTDSVPQVFTMHRGSHDAAWGDPHASFLSGPSSEPDTVAQHLRQRAERWGFALLLEEDNTNGRQDHPEREGQSAREAG